MLSSPAVSFLGRCRFLDESSVLPGLIVQATGIRSVQLEPSVVGLVEPGVHGANAGRLLQQQIAFSTTVPILKNLSSDQSRADEAASISRMPIEALLQLSQCSICVIAPMESADFDLIDNVLERLPSQTKVILQLSADQLRDHRRTQRLMLHLEAIVIESQDLPLFSYGRTQHDSLRHIHEQLHVNVLMSSQSESVAMIDGRILELPLSDSRCEEASVPADCLAAGYAAGLAMQQSRIGSFELGHHLISGPRSASHRSHASAEPLQVSIA